MDDPITALALGAQAVAALVLPDGRPVAVTGGADATVRVLDLSAGVPIGACGCP